MPDENRAGRIAAAVGVVVLHLIVLQILVFSVLRIPMPEIMADITWLNLAPPAQHKNQSETEPKPDQTKPSALPEPIWAMPPPLETQTDTVPDFAGLGRMLNVCKIENLSLLSKAEQKRCGLLMLGLPNHAADGGLTQPSQVKDPERFARERAKQKAPVQLPCFGEKGFNPFGEGCLSGSGE